MLPELDAERVACLGNSGGGIAAYYAACIALRKLVVGELGHRFYADPTWKVFAALSGWKE